MQVPFVFRSATNEILYMSHLDTVNARWKYDIMWAAGLYSTYDLFFSAIDEKTREVSNSCTCSCRNESVHGLVSCLPPCQTTPGFLARQDLTVTVSYVELFLRGCVNCRASR